MTDIEFKPISAGNNLLTPHAPSILIREVYHFYKIRTATFTIGVWNNEIVCVPKRLGHLLTLEWDKTRAEYEAKGYDVEKVV